MGHQADWTSSELGAFPSSGISGSAMHVAPAVASFPSSNDPRWQLVQRIASSASFEKSALLRKFLIYVSDLTMSGRAEEICEHQIGVEVFGRRPGYKPGEDNIVRNYARQLRQRLDQYFEDEGKHEELRLNIPRGTYVPSFALNKPKEPASAGDEEELVEGANLPHFQQAPTVATAVGLRRPALMWSVGILALILAIAGGVLAWMLVPRKVQIPTDTSHALWSQMFNPTHQTFLVPADDGIVMIQNLTNHSIHLAEYINRDYVSVKSPQRIDAQNMADLDQQRYTSMADLNAILKFSRLSEATADHFIVRYARELHMEDLKDSNAILLGSSFSNPWVDLFQKNLNFEFDYQPRPNESIIVNRHPVKGEQEVYTNDATAPSHRTYAVIAMVPNLNDTGWVLIVEGLTMAGTQAAADVLFNREAMRPILERAQSANGQLKPFELLIETRSFGSNAPQASIIASRIDPRFPA